MVAKQVSGFGGMLPISDDRLLPDNAAARTENTWLYSGALAGMNTPGALRTLSSTAIAKVYRIPNNFVDSQHLSDAVWLEFQDIDTDIVKSLVIGETFERYYFASPTAPPRYNTKARIAATNQTKSLLHLDGTNGSTVVFDSALTGNAHLWTVHGSAALSTAAVKFGTTSCSFPTGSDWIDTPANSDFNLGSGNWTIDFWFQLSDTGVLRYLCGQNDSLLTALLSAFTVQRTALNKIQATVYTGSTPNTVTGTTSWTTGAFHHFALIRTGNTMRMFLDGVQEGGDVTLSGAVNTSANNLAIGSAGELRTSGFNGYIDEFRFTVGAALCVTNFAVPTAASDVGGAWLLGVPAPSVAPSVVPTGGASTVQRTSAYVYTWVTAYGEEGPPSPATVITGKVDATYGITLAAATASDLGVSRNLTKVRIYRTVTSASGAATFFLVVEQAIGTTSYNDTISDATISANSPLASTNWIGPPSDLKGFVVMPNGILAGFRNNEIWFCEPFRPHAWPAQYTLVVDYPIVGLGVVNQTLVVCTQAYPYAIGGIHPSVMTQSKLQSLQPCMSRGSILSAPEGVYYVSPNGLILVSNGMVVNVTEKVATKDQWQKLVTLPSLTTLRAARVAGAYYSFGSARPGVFEETAFDTDSFTQADNTGAINGALIDPNTDRIIIEALNNVTPCINVMNDPWTGELFVIRNGVLYWIDIASITAAYEAYKWRSKIFQTPLVKNFEAVKVYFDLTTGSPPALNANRDIVSSPAPLPLAADRYGYIDFYADGRLVQTRELRTSGELFRLPSGFKAKYWQFEINARVKILSVEMATTAKELAGV